LSAVLPALGYSPQQCRDLEKTIHRSDAEILVDASPARLDRVLNLRIPVVRVCYRFRQIRGTVIESIVDRFLDTQVRGA
jgi:predicted GTPase